MKVSGSSSIDIMPVPEGEKNKVTELEQAKARRLQEATQVASDFENIFSEMMLKSMRQTVNPADPQSNAMSVYQGMLDTEYSKTMSEGQGLGIKDKVLEWIRQNDALLAEPNQKMLAKSSEVKKQSQDFKSAMDQYKVESMRLDISKSLNK